MSNNSNSDALERAKCQGIPFRHLSGVTHPNPDERDAAICNAMAAAETDLVILTGYMKKLGQKTLVKFKGRILNTHPALLPKFGGKGMYGMNVHRAVIAAGDCESGVSIHIVDVEYGTGPIVAQYRVDVAPDDTAETLCERVMNRERRFLVDTLRRISEGTLKLDGV